VTRGPRLLLISGSLRAGSTNTAVLRTVEAFSPGGTSAVLYPGLAALPHFNPDDDVEGEPLHPAVAELRGQIGDADALLFSTPEYAGALPGSFKNLLDWTVGGGEIYRKPAAWLNVSSAAAPTGGRDAHDSLRNVLGYAGAEIVEAACLRVAVPRTSLGADGLVEDGEIRAALLGAEARLCTHVEVSGSESSESERRGRLGRR
jgi:chromate reductase